MGNVGGDMANFSSLRERTARNPLDSRKKFFELCIDTISTLCDTLLVPQRNNVPASPAQLSKEYKLMNTKLTPPAAGHFWARTALPGQVLENGYKHMSGNLRTHATPAEVFAARLLNGESLESIRTGDIACDGVEWPLYPGHINCDSVMRGKTPQAMANAMKRPEAIAAMKLLAKAYEAEGVKL